MGMIGEPSGIPVKVAEPQKAAPITIAPVTTPERVPVEVGAK